MYHSLLVPLDGSQFAEAALPIAAAIAQRAGATLEVVRAHTLFEPDSPAICWGPYYDPAQDAAYKAVEHAYLDATVQAMREKVAIAITSTLVDGSVVDSVLKRARAIAADLIVMTTHGRGPITRFWLGSVADVLLRRATIPVLLVHGQDHGLKPKPADSLNRILIPLDGSEVAEQVLPLAIALGRLMDAEFTLLRAVEPGRVELGAWSGELGVAAFSRPGQPEFVGIAPGAPPAPCSQLPAKRDAACYLERLAAKLRAESLQVETIILECDPAAAILHAAITRQSDLIAIATHGRGGLERLLVGSVADKVIRNTTVPVLAYRPTAESLSDTAGSYERGAMSCEL